MARSVEDKLIHIPLDHGMDQSVAIRTAPIGTLYRIENCRKRGPKGVLECRPGRSQIPSTCLGESTHYIAGDGATGYVYRPCFITRVADSPLLGTSAGEVFCFPASANWHFCGRFSTCLPLKKYLAFSPTKLAPNSTAGGTIFPPQVAVNSAGFRMSVAVDSAHTIQACIDSPEGVRQAIAWSATASVRAARIVALGTKFLLFWQSGTNISVNTYVPTAGSGGVAYVEVGSVATLPSSSYYWDVTADDPASATVLCFASSSADRTIAINTYNSSVALVNSATLKVGSGPVPMALWRHPTSGDYWLGFNDTAGGATGTDVNANVNTSINNTLRIRTSKASSYSVISVTSGAAVSKAQIAIDLNAAFGGAGLLLSASVVGTNQIKIVNTSTLPGVPGSLIDIDSVGAGSNLNVAVGFPTGQSNTFGGSTYAIFSATLATVLTYATISASLGTSSFGVSPYVAPLFGYYRDVSPSAGTAGFAMYAIGHYDAASTLLRVTYMGLAGPTGSVSPPCAMANMIPATKPDNYGRLWVLLDSGVGAFPFSRYALLRFFSLDIDLSDSANIRLLSPPTLELVTDAFPSISSALNSDNSNGNFIGRFFSTIVSDGDAYFASLWAPVEEIEGQAPGALQTNTQPGGVLAQAQVYQYSAVEFDEPIHTHRDTDAVQQTITIAGQPVEIFGAPTAEVFYGVSGVAAAFAYAAGASEIGFLHGPPAPTISASATTSTTPAAGTYLYKAVYQWVDEFGRRHQSTPSPPVSFTADGAHCVQIVVYVIQCTQRQSRNSAQAVELILYRTVAGGTQFHETTMRTTIDSALNARAVTFTDDLADSNIDENAFLYTDGGVLANDIAPSCQFACRSEERVWFGGLWDPTIIQCSKLIVPSEPIQTPESDAFRVQLLRPCTGLSYMDGQVIAFAKDAIFLISGDGPNDQGNGGFAVRPLTLTLGCLDYRSILETEDGVLFQGTRGIYLIPRGFAPPQFIGDPIQDTYATLSADDNAPPEILASSYSLSNEGSWAKFLLRDDSESAGGTLVAMMHTDSGEWFFDRLSDAARDIGYITRSDTLRIGPGSLYAAPSFANNSGALSPVLYETATDRYDYPHNGSTKSAVTMLVISSWMTPFGLGGWGRFNKLLAGCETDTTGLVLSMSFQVDANTPDSASWQISSASQLNTAQYRQQQLASNQGTAGILSLTLAPVNTNVDAGYTAKFLSASLELEPSHGMRLMADSERA